MKYIIHPPIITSKHFQDFRWLQKCPPAAATVYQTLHPNNILKQKYKLMSDISYRWCQRTVRYTGEV